MNVRGVTLEGQESFCWKVRETDSEDLQGSQKLTGKLLQLSSLFENASVMCLGLGYNNKVSESQTKAAVPHSYYVFDICL